MRRLGSVPIWLVIAMLAVASVSRGGYNNIVGWFMNMILLLPCIIIGISFHEFAHAYVATLCGDPTPKNQGRVTINPASHVDPVGFICLLFVGFGWGYPVVINPSNFKHPRRDELLVSCAGVAMNFVIALVFAGLMKLIFVISPVFLVGHSGGIIWRMLQDVVWVNLVLLVFNLIPIPPLDGFGIITQLFNLRNTKFYWTVYNYGFYILLALMLLDITDMVLTPILSFLAGVVFGIWGI